MEKNLLKRMEIGMQRVVAVRERKREPILSEPVAFEEGSAVRKDSTSLGLVEMDERDWWHTG